mmetsp:Transcript_100682/g.324868  ORF Transcript_100682/g.324868 Transcript_100682/m.324868 type:complete len:249 (-) Transcript_100682:597-1343(-)
MIRITARTACTVLAAPPESAGAGGAGGGAGDGATHPHPVKLYLVPARGAPSRLHACTAGLCLLAHSSRLLQSKHACCSEVELSAQPQPCCSTQSASVRCSTQSLARCTTCTTSAPVSRSTAPTAVASADPASAAGLESREAQGTGSTVSFAGGMQDSGAPRSVLTLPPSTSRRAQPSTKRTLPRDHSTCCGSCAVAASRGPSLPSPPRSRGSLRATNKPPSFVMCSLRSVRFSGTAAKTCARETTSAA